MNEALSSVSSISRHQLYFDDGHLLLPFTLTLCKAMCLDGHLHFDGGVGIVSFDEEVAVLESINVL